ncbi:ATP-binding protein [Kribbella orskensis]|uniref:ATP-binding protein n=1 Tax=Kribbella orskensis TaxID=2512216 RepID=UPI0034E2614B
MQADDLYDLISKGLAEDRSIAITANRAPQDWYPLFLNPVVAESLLDRLINTGHQVFVNGPFYRPNKLPKRRPRPPDRSPIRGRSNERGSCVTNRAGP